MSKVTIIGNSVRVDFGRRAFSVPAKVDTGADSSSVWASKIRIDEDGKLIFSLFGKGSPYYNGKVYKRSDYKVAKVRSANGHEQVKYRTHFSVKINGRKIKVLFNLSDRSSHKFPVLIGRRTISNKFIVDVSKSEVKRESVFANENKVLNAELEKDPIKFHKKYYGGGK